MSRGQALGNYYMVKEAFLLEAGTGMLGRSAGAKKARRILRSEGYSEREIADAEDDARGYGHAAASGIGHSFAGGLAGGAVGAVGGPAGLALGAGLGSLGGMYYGYKNNKSATKREMLSGVRRRPRDDRDAFERGYERGYGRGRGRERRRYDRYDD